MNYDEIRTNAYAYSDRSMSSEAYTRYDDFLRIVEARVNRVLQTMKMTKRSTITTDIDEEYYGLPVDFEGMRDIQVNNADSEGKVVTLEYRTPAQMNELANTPETYSVPGTRGIYYSFIADQLQIYPPQDAKTLEMIYYQKVPQLTDVVTTNWLSDESPDCYVFGVIVEISAFVKDAESTALWNSRFTQSLSEIKNNDVDVRWGSGNALQTRVI